MKPWEKEWPKAAKNSSSTPGPWSPDVAPEPAQGNMTEMERKLAAFNAPGARERRDAIALDAFAERNPFASKAATFLSGAMGAGSYVDEALGSLAGYLGPNSAEDATNIVRAMRAREERLNPGTSTALKIGGGVTSAIGGAGAISNLPKVSGAVSTVAEAIKNTPRLAQALIGTGLLGTGGAIEGGIYGYGEGETPEERRKEAKEGAALGGTLGAVLGFGAPYARDAAKWMMEKGLNAVGGRNRVVRALGLSPVSAQVLRRQGEVEDAVSGAENIRSAGQDAMVVDAGEGFKGLLDQTIQESGPAGTKARKAVEERAKNAHSRLMNILDETFGEPRGIQSSRREIREGTADARTSAYGAAYARPIDYSDPLGQEIEGMVKRRVPESAIEAANLLMRTEDASSKQILAKIADDGSIAFEVMPDVRQLDYITRGLNEVAEKADGQGKLGGTTATGKAFRNLATDIRTRLKRLVPEYEVALETAGDAITESNALKEGAKILMPGTTRDDVSELLHGSTGPERQRYKEAIRTHIDDLMARVQRTMSDSGVEAREAIKVVKELSSRANREKVAMVIGDDAAARLFTQVDEQAEALSLKAAVSDNSKTFARQELGRVKKEARDTTYNRLTSGEPLEASKRFTQTITGNTPQAQRAASDRENEEIVKFLLRRRGADAVRALEELSNINNISSNNERIARALAVRATNDVLLPTAYQGGQVLLGPR